MAFPLFLVGIALALLLEYINEYYQLPYLSVIQSGIVVLTVLYCLYRFVLIITYTYVIQDGKLKFSRVIFKLTT